MEHASYSVLLLALSTAIMATSGCSDDGDDGNRNTGGSTSTGGVSSTGGGTATGGTTNAGGTTSTGGSHSGGSGTTGGTGSSSGGSGGTGAAACNYDLPEGATGISVTTAVVLIDNVVIRDESDVMVVQWQFDTDATVVDTTADTGDKWTRTSWAPLNDEADSENSWLACDGNPAAGSMKTVIPFAAEATIADRYFQVHVPFAEADYHDYSVTAQVRLLAGEGACAPTARIFTLDVDNGAAAVDGVDVSLAGGDWTELTLEIPTAVVSVDQILVNISWQGCT